MAHAELCPVCKGTGRHSDDNTKTIGAELNICHGCSGKGWVTVEDRPYSTICPPIDTMVTYY